MSNLGVPIPTSCPRCGGPLWDNRANKKTPKSPDFRCKDKECVDPETGFTTSVYLPRQAPPAPRASKVPAPRPAVPIKHAWSQAQLIGSWFATYRAVVDRVSEIWPADTPPEVLGQQISTAMIALQQAGATKPPNQPAPPVPLEEMPPALQEPDDDDLPY